MLGDIETLLIRTSWPFWWHTNSIISKNTTKLKKLINRIFQCENFDIVEEAKDLPPFTNYDNEEIPIAVVLCCIKWLFIKQDITYWNRSGRSMLFNGLQKKI
ncbi:hypothetical protein [Helicobacter sp.]|uniref:hypothetical protein n=1 Tax=Helicobacter sp. TaxID=218 RepID=UPI0025C1D43E|nr:hypothetical protein [Helicobacter sp.]MCI5968304.1 hypothetical protein [Helicobacter sp.]